MTTKTKEQQIGEAILAALGMHTGAKHDATGTPTTTYGHGQDATGAGVFTYPGVNRDVFAAIVGAEPGLWGLLPKYGSRETNPVFLSLLGVLADTGSEPTEVCGAAPVAGLSKSCKLTSVFGKYRRQTREIDLTRIGKVINNSDPMNLQLMNFPGLPNDLIRPQFGGMTPAQALQNEIAKLLLEFGASVSNLLARQIWIGNPANNNGDAYKEMTGIDLLIGTGKVDVESGNACPALDSDVKDFNYGLVDQTNSAIIDYLTYLARYLKKNARTMGFEPVQWVIAMREELHYEITAVWPCRYLTYRCQSNQDSSGIDPVGQFDSAQAIALRDDMRQGRYLLIDGVKWPVVYDDGITEESSDDTGNLQDGQFASDIYFIPLTVLGGKPVTYIEHFDFGNPDLNAALGAGGAGGNGSVFTTNNGAWFWTHERTRSCLLWQAQVEPRLILRTPQLAGKLQNVAYQPLQHTRQPFPADGYFKDGGNSTYRSNSRQYSEWNSPN